MKFFRIILWVQTLYYFITGIWPVADITSFMEVTGSKTDIWLVKTVAVLLLAISVSFFVQLFNKRNPAPAIALAMSCCVALGTIDFYYVTADVIAPVYLLDGVLQILLLTAWIVFLLKNHKNFRRLP